MKKFIRLNTIIFSLISIFIFSFIIYGSSHIPDEADTFGSEIYFSGIYSANIEKNNAYRVASIDDNSAVSSKTYVKLFGTIPVKEISVTQKERKYLIPGGDLVGIKLKTDGVLIVGTESFNSPDGEAAPADSAGIEVGDTLISIDGIKVTTNEQISSIIQKSQGNELDVKISRNGQHLELTLTPEISALTGNYKCGLWIRDSTGGIGTMTYCDIENGTFASLGHGIYDVDTGQLMPTCQGELSDATLSGVKKGTSGEAGELKGSISGEVYGNIISNNENGIYGTISYFEIDSAPLPAANSYEIETGYAQIISTVSGNEKEYYDIEIEKICKNSDNKNMIIRITDERLLGITGGIVQGMSGSPIIQNGKIVGAVTHVFVNEPTKGYAITIEKMLETEENL